MSKNVGLFRMTADKRATYEEGRGGDFWGDKATELTANESRLHDERDPAYETRR